MEMSTYNEKEEAILRKKKTAVLRIENCWCCHRDRRMFSIMKEAIQSAEYSLTSEILRKINPREAELLSDPVFKSKIRFRFSGGEFPPHIVFKIFIETNGRGIKYFCGKKAFKSSTQAARESCSIMGNRKYFDQIISDLWEDRLYKINDELDVSNMQEYMKYLSAMDEKSPSVGGKGNPWRTLTLEDLPRHHLIYDVVNYLQLNMTSSLFLKYLRTNNRILLSQPHQLEYIHNIKNLNGSPSHDSEPRRRSKQALERVKKMQRLYKFNEQHQNVIDEHNKETLKNHENPKVQSESKTAYVDIIKGEIDVEDESWDEEGKYLFEWTRTLSVDKFT